MFRLLAYTASLGVNATDSELAAVNDPQLTIQNNHFLPNEDTYLLGAYFLETSGIRLKIDTPTLRAMYLPYVRPLERAVAVPNRPNFVDYTGFELLLKRAEEIKVLASNNLGAATEQSTLFLWLGDRMRNVQPGSVYTMRVTATITVVANGWASAQLTFDQTLPSGRYSIVGMDAFGTGLQAARLILPGYAHRPGVIAAANAGIFTGPTFRMGNLGEFGQFVNTALPQLEVFGVTAGAQACEAYLDLIRIG